MDATLSVEELLGEKGYSSESPLRIYLGAAPGVGKTYRMLQDGNALKAKGVDVVIGYVESHQRSETDEQIGSLQVIPRKKLSYRGVDLEEMDTVAVIARKPQLVLIDELAHTNASGSKNEKRYQDIEDILAAGIAVFSTCNIQHLESIHDVVERMTGIQVRERVPDTFFNLAKEVILVDISTEELRDRMRSGRIYKPHKIDQALNNFFTPGNIAMLREIALRELANDVEEKSKQARAKVSKAGRVSSEKLLVAINDTPESKSLIRVGSRMANRNNARWYVVYVDSKEIGRKSRSPEEQEKILKENFDLARSLGARVVQFSANKAADAILSFASEEGITHIVLGATKRSWWRRILSGSVVTSILKRVGELAVHVYPLKQESEEVSPTTNGKRSEDNQAVRLTDYLTTDRILANLKDVATVEQTISLLIDHLIQCNPKLASHRQTISEMILRREKLMSTFLETGIAIPHSAGFEEITDIQAVAALTPQGIISLGRDQKAYIVILFISSELGRASHLRFLASIAKVFIDETTTREIASSVTSQDAYELIQKVENLSRK